MQSFLDFITEMNTRSEVLTERQAKLSSVLREMQSSECIIISPERGENTPEENSVNFDKLLEEIFGLGSRPPLTVLGRFLEETENGDDTVWVEERSTIIPEIDDKLRHAILDAALRFGQDSVLRTIPKRDGNVEGFIIPVRNDGDNPSPSNINYLEGQFSIGFLHIGKEGSFPDNVSQLSGRQEFTFTEEPGILRPVN